jgi:putative NADPH-quinone reductase
MRVMVTIDHPWEQSFNHEILRLVEGWLREGGHEVDILDLHQAAFDPVMHVEELAVYSRGGYRDPKVREYQQRIEQAQHLIYIFPVWWEVMPALLKGFFDKVFLPDWAFRERDAGPLLTHIRTGTAITTMGAPHPLYTSVEPVLCKGILEFCGVQRTAWFNLCQVSQCPPQEREAWLAGIEAYIRALA